MFYIYHHNCDVSFHLFSGSYFSIWYYWWSNLRNICTWNVFSLGKYFGNLDLNYYVNIRLYYVPLIMFIGIMNISQFFQGAFVGGIVSVTFTLWLYLGRLIAQNLGEFSTDKFLKSSVTEGCPSDFLTNSTNLNVAISSNR